MDEKKQGAIEQLERDIERIKRKIEQVKALPDNLDVSVISAWQYGVNLTIPFDVETIRKVRAQLANYEPRGKGKSFAHVSETYGDLHFDLKERCSEDPQNLTIIAETERIGATCHRMQTGTREVPVYKIVCDGETK